MLTICPDRQRTSLLGSWPEPDGHGRFRRWLSTRHALWLESLVLIGVYGAYDAGRGLAAGGQATAVRHGRDIASVEQRLGLSVERSLQVAAVHVPGLLGVFGFGYATFHLGVTAAVLLWLHRRHPDAFPWARTAFAAATAVALVGFALFPTAPPRLDGIGVRDTLALGRATSESGLLRVLYNPYAAMPSVHVAFAVLVGVSLVRYGRSRGVKVLGWVYPGYVALEVMATGNHFLFDVIAGAVVAGLATAVASKAGAGAAGVGAAGVGAISVALRPAIPGEGQVAA